MLFSGVLTPSKIKLLLLKPCTFHFSFSGGHTAICEYMGVLAAHVL